MGTEQGVTAAFLAGLDAAGRSRLAGWEPRLAGLLEEALRAWPGLAVAPEDFLRWLVARLPAAGPDAEAPRVADLYLVFACTRGDTVALRRFEQHYVPELEAALVRLRLSHTQRDELRQELRQKLLVSEDGAAPRIGLYGGRGALRHWVRAVATREGLMLLRKSTPEVGVDEELFDTFPAAAEDVELQQARREYQAEFKRAFEEALASLEPGERNLLRRHFIDGLSTPQLAALHGLHRVSMFRRLRQTCEALVERTRKLLLERLPVSELELASLNRLIRSHLDISLERLLPPE
ncbi:sigma-70 family RNA polymerase sigma factor [Myxococcus sp. AM010]|uniref:sigma-70 family RNA polymerase sigma factor n=1 Tax=Myxococcus sp. AM010 TaxID=2745138 RepID=UPI00159523F7|nr:sigma-70 family RNA polymerase sigma factor [Myxococcus sp. AM010]